MHPKHISITDYTYELPDEKIARYPLPQRDASKLLVYRNGDISKQAFRQIADFLPKPALLVFNNSKVVAARLIFEKSSGGKIEVFALEPHERYADITTAMMSHHTVEYKCLVGGASKWKPGAILEKQLLTADGSFTVAAEMLERRSDCFIIRFSWQPEALTFAQVLNAFGQVPIPPYLQRQPEASDIERYQTLYAASNGSVAAPTAGLHFSPFVFEKLEASDIQKAYITLHVGAGTFKPVKAEKMQEHEMHAEFLEVDVDCIDSLLANEEVIPVGTTSMRTIESLYWMGVKAMLNPKISQQDLQIHQWTVYDDLIHHSVSKADALLALKYWMIGSGQGKLMVKTQIIIAPGYPFKICRGLVTNFHQPNSTLLLLVAALVGSHWKEIYQYALASDFRFLSYGDSCLLLPQHS